MTAPATGAGSVPRLSEAQQDALIRFLQALVDQDRARVIVPANEPREGFWFGGGNLLEDDGSLWITGRFRNFGDSRTGLAAGTRGLECSIFRSTDRGRSFEKVTSWSKADLSHGADVLSIEGTALHRLPDGGWELFVSTEKDLPYPDPYRDYQKPGTGVWSIDRMTGTAPDRLDPATIATVLASHDPGYLHVKDPVVYDDDGGTSLLFCSHPISWASSNSGLARRKGRDDEFEVQSWQLVPRGPIWDVAVTRVTNRLPVPRKGRLRDVPPLVVLFYDGAECVRRLDESPRALKRPRGYSCEELGGALWAPEGDWAPAQRLSEAQPLFVSPHGTGSSRYVSTLTTADGVYATWQQSQPDGSQPLVLNFLPHEEVEALLAG